MLWKEYEAKRSQEWLDKSAEQIKVVETDLMEERTCKPTLERVNHVGI